jgi:hypothetical protein
MDLAYCKDRLSKAGVSFDAGLTHGEISAIEREYGFSFPPDLREFLGCALPVSKGWVDWRRAARSEIIERLGWPFESMCFDIEHNSFWLESWGPKPAALPEAYEIARAAVSAAPRLIPVCGHRFMPDRPCEAGNPIFSVYQTDIIHYGSDLFDYFYNEFGYYFGRTGYRFDGRARHIEFWSDLVDG